jgi:hypothetical protein
MLCFNHSILATRTAFVDACVNATTRGGFNGCFIDSAGVGDSASQAGLAKKCHTSPELMKPVSEGIITLLNNLQAAVGSNKLIIAKDNFMGGSEEYVNSVMPMDTFCSCYSCDVNTWASTVARSGLTYAGICQTQIQEAIKLGKRGQVSVLHGEVNAMSKGNSTALAEDFTFSLAGFLIAAADSSFFGYSDKWYYNGTTWHPEYDHPLGEPTGDAIQGTGAANMTWSRSFASGTVVELDVFSYTASIKWSKSTPPL